jgi:Fic family protein
VRSDPGTVIAGPTGIVYTPPVGETRIRELLANWEDFLHGADGIDPLVRMAATHYQFEAIHPFTDGNGRTGRVLNTLFLVEQGLLSRPILYLSRHIIAHRAEYYRLLLDVTRASAWEPWVLYILQGVEETAAWTTAKIEAVLRLRVETARFVRDRAPKTYRPALIDLLFDQPYCRIADVVDAGIAERQTASRYLRMLVELGVLRDRRLGREKLFFHPKLLGLLTEEPNEFTSYL